MLHETHIDICNKANYPKYKNIFNNNKTNNNQLFLRDYSYKILYKANGKKAFAHEHIIYISNF